MSEGTPGSNFMRLPGPMPVLLAGLTFLVGAVSCQVPAYLDTAAVVREPQPMQRQAMEQPQLNKMVPHLNALVRRFGYMQADLVRLNDHGQRLVLARGLGQPDSGYAQGSALVEPSPVRAVLSISVPDFLRSFEKVSGQIEIKSRHLVTFESVLRDRQERDRQAQAIVIPLGWPTTGGWVSSGFGRRSDPFTRRAAFHEGVDIASRRGSRIMSIGGGVVSYSGVKEGYGCIVEIDHGNGYATRYAHCKSVLVRVGDRVTKGQGVALVGTTGRSTGPHVHFEILRDGKAINPGPYLRPPLQQWAGSVNAKTRMPRNGRIAVSLPASTVHEPQTSRLARN